MVGRIIGPYRVISPIGKGGMGEVFLAEDTRLGRKVALKLLSEELTSQAERVLRFQQEARAASALNHPNILTIHEIGQTGEAHFMATEFVEGVTLRDHMKRGVMSVQEVVDIGTQIATALVAAHAAGIVHRDIKPENVMIRHDGLIKVLDFGIAKLLQPQLAMSDPEATTRVGLKTRPGALMGTVSYMSPEQARAMEVDERSDIWSLGVMLYEMIGRRRPFEGPTMSHIIVSILESEPASLATLSPDVSLDIQQVVTRCLEKDRDKRYQTMRDVAAELQTIKSNLYFEARLRSGAPSVGSPSVPTLVVEGTPSHSTAQSLSRRRKTRSAIDSLAVLPLVNASLDPNMEYLSDGITENIINNLAQVPKLRVVPRNTVFRYKGSEIDPQEIGKALHTRAVLTGRVRQLGDRLIVGVELVDVVSESQLWGEQFNLEFTDIFKIQEEIATEIIEKLRLKLTDTDKKRLAKRHTRKTESYRAGFEGSLLLEQANGRRTEKRN